MLNKRIFLGVFIFLLLAVALIAGIYGKNTQEKVSIVNNEDYEISNAISDEAPKVREITINIIETKMTVNGKEISRYLYTDENNKAYSTGYPIIANIGDTLKITVNNKTSVPTNMHWHGLEISNDQDGPDIIINPNDTHKYDFKLNQSGTYWYHSHNRPVRDQVDEGMYAPLIVKEKNDYKYNKDYIVMIDDWTTKNTNASSNMSNMDMGSKNSSMGNMDMNNMDMSNMGSMMEIIGDTDTINGKSYNEINPIKISTGEVDKLRFINASTARITTINFPFEVLITHMDGIALQKSQKVRSVKLAPGERVDVEISLDEKENKKYIITNDRNAGFSLPVIYTKTDSKKTIKSYFVPNTYDPIGDVLDKPVDYDMILSDRMGNSTHEWTINGEIFPNVKSFEMSLNKVYKIRIENKGMHVMEHPIHLHGIHFKVVSINGKAVDGAIYKDTISVNPNEYVDVAVKYTNPGMWMVHCHVLDHEDGGMMMEFHVK
mgnify:CR=1 FL=1